MSPRISRSGGELLRDVRIDLTPREAWQLVTGLGNRLEQGSHRTEWEWRITDTEDRELTVGVLDETPPGAEAPTVVRDCPRCGEDHEGITWQPLAPSIGKDARTRATHWTLCPTSGERITRTVFGNIDAASSVERWVDDSDDEDSAEPKSN